MSAAGEDDGAPLVSGSVRARDGTPAWVALKVGSGNYKPDAFEWEVLKDKKPFAWLKELREGSDFGSLFDARTAAQCNAKMYCVEKDAAERAVEKEDFATLDALEADAEREDRARPLAGRRTIGELALEMGVDSTHALLLRVVLHAATGGAASASSSAAGGAASGGSGTGGAANGGAAAASGSDGASASTATGAPVAYPEFPSASSCLKLSEDNPIFQLVAAIRGKRVVVTADGHLQLPDPLKWPDSNVGTLFVRDCYKSLYESALNECRPLPGIGLDHEQNNRIITGQSDSGKTMFLWYMLYRILTDQPGRTIILGMQADIFGIIIQPRGPPRWFNAKKECIEVVGMMPDIDKASALLLVDSSIPGKVPFPTIVVTSRDTLCRPGQSSLIKRFSVVHLYMPIPTAEELLEMRRA